MTDDGLNNRQNELAGIPTTWLRLRPWREFSAMALIMMDVNWIVPLFQSVTNTGARQQPLTAALLIGGVLLAAYLTARVLFFLQLKTLYRQLFLLVGLSAAALVLLKRFLYPAQPMGATAVLERMSEDFANPVVLMPAELMVIVVTALIWWRGVQLANHWLGPGSARRSFRWGTIMLLFVALLRVESGLEMMLPHLALFLFSALVAVGAARAASLSQLRGADHNPLGAKWLAAMLGVAVGLVLIAASLAIFVSGQPSVWISGLVLWSVRIILAAVLIIISPFIVLFIWLFIWLTSLISNSPVLQAMQEQLVEVASTLADFFYSVGEFLRQIWLQLPPLPWLKPVLLWSLVVLVLVVMFKRFGVKWRLPFFSRPVSPATDVEALSNDLLASFRLWLAKGIDQVGQRLTHLSLGGRLMAAARIRRIYTQLMALSAELGSPRREWQTPLEFMVTLHGLFPDQGEALVTVTGAYVRVRYGELPESRVEMNRVEEAWRKIKAQGKQIKKVHQTLQEAASQERMRDDFNLRRTQ